MAFTDKQEGFAYVNGYAKDKYDKVVVLLPKGDKDRYKAIAKENGMSVSEMIRKAVSVAFGDSN